MQRRGHHFRAFFGRVGRGPTLTRGVGQGVQTTRVKAGQPMVDGAPVELQLGRNGAGRLALQATPHDGRAFDQARLGLTAMGQSLDVGPLGGVHFSQRKHLPKARGFHPPNLSHKLAGCTT
jgi:hypothetical protein